MYNSDPIQMLLAEVDKKRSERGVLEQVLQAISELVMPNRGDFTTVAVTPGARRDMKVFDSTAVQANEALANILHSGLISPNMKWATLQSSNVKLHDDENAQRWIESVTDSMFNVLANPKFGFYTNMHELFLDLTAYGTCVLYIGDEPGKPITFQCIHLKEVFISENCNGVVDTVYREFEYTARQILQKWPDLEERSEKIRKALVNDPEHKFTVIHKVCPRIDAERCFKTIEINEKFDVASIYVLKDEPLLISTSGYYEMPYVVGRWSKVVGEPYGRSPGWNALSDIRMLNVMSEVAIMSDQKSVSPTMLVADDGVMMPLNLKPNGIIVGGIDANTGNQLVTPLQTGVAHNVGIDAMEQRKDAIRKAFYVDQFMERQGVQPLTATEALDRQEMRLRLTGPHLNRIEAEILTPLVDRIFAIMQRRGLFDEAPEELSGDDLKVVYISPLANTQKSQETIAYQKVIQAFGPFIQVQPTILDNINLDSGFRDGAIALGINMKHIRPQEEVDAMRQAAAEQQQQEAQLQQAAMISDSAAKLMKAAPNV